MWKVTLLHLKLVLLSRLFSWALLWFLNRLFLNVQLHKGQMKMVHKAVQEVSQAIPDRFGWSEQRQTRLIVLFLWGVL